MTVSMDSSISSGIRSAHSLLRKFHSHSVQLLVAGGSLVRAPGKVEQVDNGGARVVLLDPRVEGGALPSGPGRWLGHRPPQPQREGLRISREGDHRGRGQVPGHLHDRLLPHAPSSPLQPAGDAGRRPVGPPRAPPDPRRRWCAAAPEACPATPVDDRADRAARSRGWARPGTGSVALPTCRSSPQAAGRCASPATDTAPGSASRTSRRKRDGTDRVFLPGPQRWVDSSRSVRARVMAT